MSIPHASRPRLPSARPLRYRCHGRKKGDEGVWDGGRCAPISSFLTPFIRWAIPYPCPAKA